MTRVVIHHDVIKDLHREMQASLDTNGPLRVPIVAEAPDGLGSDAAGATNFYLPRLLLWLDQRRREDPSHYAELDAFAADEAVEPEFVGNLITVLEQRRHFRTAGGIDSPVMPESFITDLGRAEAQRLRELRADPVARTRYARDVLANWLFANFRGSLADIAGFGQARQSIFLGDQLSSTEILDAVQYLASQAMVSVDPGEVGVQLTPTGIECVLSGVSVSDYSRQQMAGGDTFIVGTAQGSVLGGQHQTVTQTVSFGFNPNETAQLVNFAALVKQIGPTLGLPEAEHRELQSAADTLTHEAESPTSEQSRLRLAAERLVTGLTSATRATTALTMLVEAGRKAFTAVFGG